MIKFFKLPMLLDQNLKNLILSFALETGLEYFSSNGNNRRYCNVNKFNLDITKKISEFSTYCYTEYFGIKIQDEPKYGNFIGVHESGGFVHPHKDSKGPDNEHHIRFNFLVSKPSQGGMPILNGIRYNIDENNGWMNVADEWEHSSSVVIGDKHRIVLSMGNLIDEDNFNRLLAEL